MDDQHGSRPEDHRPKSEAEGVRIIGPDEAAEVMERDDIVARRTDDELRYGDRPPAPPAGPRPALRFPLDASADPTRIERPPVQPAPDPVTGPVELPHWSEPPTGEVPAVLISDDAPLIDDDGSDLDAWSSFATSTPRWRDADDAWVEDDFMERLASDSDDLKVGALGNDDDEPLHEEYFGFDDLEARVEERTSDPADDDAPRLETGGDDWSASAEGPRADDLDATGWIDDQVWDDEGGDVVDQEAVHRESVYADDFGAPGGHGSSGDRDIATAVMVGGGLAIAAIVLMWMGPRYMVAMVTVALGLAAVEYFNALRKVGWEAATLVGITACALFPYAVYWRGPLAYPLIGFLVVVTVLSWYLVGAGGPDPRVLEGSGATLLGVAWIGGLGSIAAAMLRAPDGSWLFVTAVAATVAYDVGGLFIGRAMGHRPLTSASPNKTVEGLIGGMACSLLTALILVGIFKVGPWTGFAPALVLGLGAACAAPLGDLCQSLLKRDLGVKDMGSILPGHGGVLDRFDGLLFVMPTLFWLTVAFGHVI